MADLISAGDVLDRLARPFTTDETQRIAAVLADVSALVRAATGQTFDIVETTELLPVRGRTVKLPQRPVVDVTAVTAPNGTDVTFDFIAGDVEITLASSWYLNVYELNVPAVGSFEKVTVTYEHGYTATPADVVAIAAQIAIRTLAGAPDETGITTETIGSYSYTRSAAGVNLLDDERVALLAYRAPVLPALML